MEKKPYTAPSVIAREISHARLCAGSFSYHDEEANKDVGAGAKSSMVNSIVNDY